MSTKDGRRGAGRTRRAAPGGIVSAQTDCSPEKAVGLPGIVGRPRVEPRAVADDQGRNDRIVRSDRAIGVEAGKVEATRTAAPPDGTDRAVVTQNRVQVNGVSSVPAAPQMTDGRGEVRRLQGPGPSVVPLTPVGRSFSGLLLPSARRRTSGGREARGGPPIRADRGPRRRRLTPPSRRMTFLAGFVKTCAP